MTAPLVCFRCDGSGRVHSNRSRSSVRSCALCRGTGIRPPLVHLVWRALDAAATSPDKRVLVAEAIAVAVADLQRLDARSPAVWVLLGMLEGEAPVDEATRTKRATACHRAKVARQAEETAA